jgi:hypothetical protein
MVRGVPGVMARCLSLGVAVVLGVLLCCLVYAGCALAVGDATTVPGESCPNEASSGFRAYLAECRAFEQVTPVFKDGAELTPLELSDDGLHAIGRTLGAFAGLESDTEIEGGAYEFSRSSSGWAVSAISPPASMFPAQTLVGESPELGSTLWVSRSPSESIAAENFYIREVDGSLVKIGSLLPPSAVTGPPSGEFQGFLYREEAEYKDASDDLSHVLFTISHRGLEEGLSWPGDTTSKEGVGSLYEYSGTGQARPELVGVNNEGHSISPCGVYLGSANSHELYNAMSGDGGTVFFTAVEAGECGASEGPGVNELFARVDGLETVAISEPTSQQCAACQTGSREAAQFAGASEDGSKVFFLTEQELLPGATGENVYEYDFDAPPAAHVIRVSSGSSSPEVLGVARVTEDGSHVYFVAHGRLGEGPRGGKEQGGREGPCLAELGSAEKAEEVVAEEQEVKAEPVTSGSRCRPTEGEDNLYVFERDAAYPAGRVSFVATLSPSDASDWSASDRRLVQATPDGRFLVFRSVADLTAADASVEPQLFEYDADTGELVRVSRGSNGDEPQGTESANANAMEIPIQSFYSDTSPAQASTGLAVSADGSTVLFGDGGVLTGEVGESAGSAYEYRSSVASGGSISQGNVYLVSDGSGMAGKGVSAVEELDASGQDMFFKTAAALVASDTDEQFDSYDARRGGGFLAADPPPECVAEACGGSLYVQPSFVAPGSTTVSGGAATPAVVPVSGGSVPAVGVKKKSAPVLSREVLLARALRVCVRKRKKGARAACEARALRRYGSHRKSGSVRGAGK